MPDKREEVMKALADLLNQAAGFVELMQQTDAIPRWVSPDGSSVQINGVPELVTEARAALAAFRALPDSQWLPIETALKVGVYLLWDGKAVQTGWWDANLNSEEPGWTNGACESYGYERDVRVKPTHWQPLPDPPASVDPQEALKQSKSLGS